MNRPDLEILRKYLIDRGLTQSAMADALGVSQAYIAQLLTGKKGFGRKTAEKFYNLFGINPSWLLTGDGQMITREVQNDVESLPLIPIDAMAGYLTGTSNAYMEYDCERFVVPVFRGADFLIRVQGDSMEPKYFSGDIIACQRVPLDRLWFQWGKTYVLDTVQGALIKRMEPSDHDGCVCIHSENPKYKPFDLPTDEINGVALVKGVIRVE